MSTGIKLRDRDPSGSEKKSSDERKSGGDRKKVTHPKHEYFKTSKPKSSREEICILNYGAGAAANFVTFMKDIQVVAGRDYGDLFSFAITDKYPQDPSPPLSTWQRDRDSELEPYNRAIAGAGMRKLQFSNENDASIIKAIDDEVDVLMNAVEAIKEKYDDMSDEEKTAHNDECREMWKLRLKAKVDKETKRETDKPKLYWLIRGNMSVESLEKVKEHLGTK